MSKFQIGLLIFFGVFFALGLAIFSGGIKLPEKSTNETGISGTITVWGTIDRARLRETFEFFNEEQNGELTINYVQKDERTYKDDLLQSFAFGGSPDVVIIPQDFIFTYLDKLAIIPNENFPKRLFDDSYIQAASIFRNESGVIGFPVFSDPIVMYYNKDILETAGFINPPKFWRELFTYTERITEKDEALNITQSGVALGEFQNVNHAKKILSALILQLGNSIVETRYDTNGIPTYTSVIGERSPVSQNPGEQALRFYTEFANPLNEVYSWNKSLPSSQDAFVAGDLAIYFGPASEISIIQRKNPNLNFDISHIPQVEEIGKSITYSDVYALAIPKTTSNFPAAFTVASSLANSLYANALSNLAGFAPVRRDILSQTPPTKFSEIFYISALQSRTWLDPNRDLTNGIFSEMVENVLSGLKDHKKSVTDTQTLLQIELDKRNTGI